MRIGRLRARLRVFTASWERPKYYSDYTPIDAYGKYLIAQVCPFDGKAFLHWNWLRQNDIIWHSHSANGLISAALTDYRQAPEWEKKTNANRKYSCLLTSFFHEAYDCIEVRFTYNLEGFWIRGGYEPTPVITVLETTRLKVKFKAETREVLLPPGATIFLSPITFMQKLGKNISIEKRGWRLPPEVKKAFTSAKTPQELAVRLGLGPIRLREKLEDRGELMRRLFDD